MKYTRENTVVISARVPEELYSLAEEFMRANYMNRNEFIKQAIVTYLKSMVEDR